MPRFLIGTIPALGHVNPFLPIARELVNRGNQVWWYGGKAFSPLIEQTGATFVPITKGIDYSNPETTPEELLRHRETLQGSAQIQFDLKHFFIEGAATQFQDYLNILQQFPADILLADSFFLGASWVAEARDIPWVQLTPSVIPFSSQNTAPFGLALPPKYSWWGKTLNRALNWGVEAFFWRGLQAYTNRLRTEVADLPPCRTNFFDTISPYLYLVATVPEFEYIREDLPKQVHFIGPVFAESESTFIPPDWWEELSGNKRVILVTQGTISNNPRDLIIPTLQALKAEDCLVLASVKADILKSYGEDSLPENVRLFEFIPFNYLLPYVDLMITNGGFNGVQMALSHGVPLIAAGKTEDKAEVCKRIEWTGVGINLHSKNPQASQIYQAVQTIFQESKYLEKAEYMQQKIRGYQPAVKAADLLEGLTQENYE